MIKEGYITKEEFLEQTRDIGVFEADLFRLWKALGGRAVHCGAPTKGGYGYHKEAVAALKELYAQRPEKMPPLNWCGYLLQEYDSLTLRKMAGL